MNSFFSALCFILAILPLFTSAINFSLRQSEEMCVSKDVIKGEYLSGEFTIMPDQGRVSVYVRDAVGATVYQKAAVPEGRFAYTAVDNGEYRVCFNNNVEPGIKSVKLKLLTGVEAKPSGAAKRKNLKPLEAQVRHVEEVVAGIVNDEQWMNERHDKMRAVNDSTAGYVFWFNAVMMAVVVAGYFFQLWFLKRYFREKKLVVD